MSEIILFEYLAAHALDREEVHQLYLSGFEIAAEIGFPSRILARTYAEWQLMSFRVLTAPQIISENVLFLEHVGRSHSPDLMDWLPLPVAAMVVPICNFLKSENHEAAFHLQFREARGIIHSIWSYNLVPVVFISIKRRGIAPFWDFQRTDWWRTYQKWREFEADQESTLGHDEMVRRNEHVRQNVLTLEMFEDEVDTLPEKLVEVLKLPSASPRKAGEKPCLTHPVLPDVAIDYAHLGGGEEAVIGFIADCAKGLLSRGQGFKIWVDAMAAPTVNISNAPKMFENWLGESSVPRPMPDEFYQDMFIKYELIKKHYEKIKNRELWLIWEDMTIATPHVGKKATPEDVWDVYEITAAFHAYVEYEGMVYDGMTALNQPIPLAEYQAHFNPVFRRAIEVAPSAVLEDTLTAVHALVTEAKYQR